MSMIKALPIFLVLFNGLFSMDVKIIAHRGFSSKAPENTMSSFQLAVDLDVDYVECDVHLTKDNKLVISHDPFVKTTNINLLDEDYKTILTHDVGGWFSSEFQGEKIPLLEDLLSMPLKKTGVMIEIKENDQVVDALTDALVALLTNKKFSHLDLVVGSFSQSIMQKLKSKAPKLPLIGIEEHADDLTFHPKKVALNVENLSKEVIADLHEKGIEVWSWTINDVDLAKEMVGYGLDGIITNYPDIMRQALLKTNVLSLKENK